MNMKEKRSFGISICLLAAFLLWTVAICFVDVRQIGPQQSSVGLAGINQLVHTWTGVHFTLYHITDWLSLVPLGVCMGFGFLGLIQWVRRKRLRKVDYSILIMGVLYLLIAAVYGLFECLVINHRPVLINGQLEASYPSSTTMLVLCVMLPALRQCKNRLQNKVLRTALSAIFIAFVVFMVVGRLFSGVHWFSDIIGGVLLSGSLVTMYDAVCQLKSS